MYIVVMLIIPFRPLSNQLSNGLGMARTGRVYLENGKDRLENRIPRDRRCRSTWVRKPSDPPIYEYECYLCEAPLASGLAITDR